jgi:DNA-binding SARP family transcriptional activator
MQSTAAPHFWQRGARNARLARPTGISGPRYADIVTLPVREPADTNSPGPEPRGATELQLLGGFRLTVGGELVDVGRTGQRLLAVVAARGRQATRSQIAHALWPDTTSDRAHANLRTALYRLGRRAPGAVHATASYLQLSAGMQIDLEVTTRLAGRILAGEFGDAAEGRLADVLHANLYEDLLPDWDDEWLTDHQYRHRQLRLTALEKLSVDLAAAGQHGAAVQAALAAVQADSLRDSAHESLIRACLAQGNRHEAYTHFTAYRRMLRDELGLDPPADLGRLLTSA